MSRTIKALTLTDESQKDVTKINKNFLSIITNSLKNAYFILNNKITNNNDFV